MYRRISIVLTGVLLLSLLVGGLAAGREIAADGRLAGQAANGSETGQEAPGPVVMSQLPFALADAEDAAQAVQVLLTFEPGDVMPTHQHGGKVLVSVIEGDLTVVRADGGEEAVYGAGETWVEEPGQQHWAENRSDSVVLLAGTFLLPEGATPTEFIEGDHTEADGPDISGQVALPVEDAANAVQVILHFAPGAVMPMHQHGGQVLVSVAAGDLTVIRDGGAEEMAYAAGETWIEEPGQQHWVENRGEDAVFVAATFLLPAGASPTEFIEVQAAEEEVTLATAKASVEMVQDGRAIVSARGNRILVDSVPPLGGPNEEMNPFDLLLGSLGTCGAFVYEAAAIELDIPLNSLIVDVEADFAPAGVRDGSVNPRVRAFRAIATADGPSMEEMEMLADQWRLRCPIYTTLELAAPIEITNRLADEEDKIANAMSGGPAVISAEAAIMEWPDVPGTEFVELRPGSNGWTCLTARKTTPGNDPMCLNETFLAMVQALDASTEAPSTGIGIGYMLQEGGPVGTPPHMMIFTPRSQEDLAALSTDMDSLTWVTGWHMFPETSYAHLMLAVPSIPEAVSVEEDKIANAMSAGPAVISAEAAIMEWPDVPGTEFVELRPGSNGWTCLTARKTTPGNDPMCLNETFLAMVQALDASTEAPSTGIGIGYMLQEGGPVGTPPHMMIFTPRSQEDLAALSTDMDSLTWVTGWHMFPETSYAHLMLAVPQPGN